MPVGSGSRAGVGSGGAERISTGIVESGRAEATGSGARLGIGSELGRDTAVGIGTRLGIGATSGGTLIVGRGSGEPMAGSAVPAIVIVFLILSKNCSADADVSMTKLSGRAG